MVSEFLRIVNDTTDSISVAMFPLLGVCVFPPPRARGMVPWCFTLRAGGKLSLKGKALEPEALEPLLRVRFGGRAERLAFISSEPEVSFAQVDMGRCCHRLFNGRLESA